MVVHEAVSARELGALSEDLIGETSMGEGSGPPPECQLTQNRLTDAPGLKRSSSLGGSSVFSGGVTTLRRATGRRPPRTVPRTISGPQMTLSAIRSGHRLNHLGIPDAVVVGAAVSTARCSTGLGISALYNRVIRHCAHYVAL